LDGSTRGRTYGFWRGILTGIVLAAAIALGLAVAVPPTVYHSPSVVPDAPLAPAAPAPPATRAQPGTPVPPRAAPGPEAPRPIAVLPGADELPDPKGLVPPAAPAVFDGGNDGSPVLAAPAGN
jgi:hypothetical protein